DLTGVEVEVDAVETDHAAEGDDELPGGQDRVLAVDVLLAGRDAPVGDVQRGRDHAFTFLIHWSTATATMTRMPVARTRHCWSTPIWESPNCRVWTMRAPMRVPMSRPRPPNRLVPPMTTAVMLCRLASG